MSFETDFKAAMKEGKAEKANAAQEAATATGLRDKLIANWRRTREKLVLPSFKKAQEWLGQEGFDAVAGNLNGTEVYLRCSGHELKFDLSLAMRRILCVSSFVELEEEYVPETFSPLHIEAKLVEFGFKVAAASP